MLTSLVRVSLFAELVAWSAIGTWLHFSRGWGIAAVLLGVAGAALGARAVLVCLTVALGWYYRSERLAAHRLGLFGVTRLVCDEYRALLLDNFYYLPFESLALRPDPVPAPGSQVPVIFVHGYLSNRGYFAPMVQWLEARGAAALHVPNFTAVFSGIDRFAGELREEIERIANASGHPQVILVCHSMGGLAARRYLQLSGEARILRLVTIASPHHGTRQAIFGVGEHARQMRRGCGFLQELEQAEARRPPSVPAVSIYTAHDNLVAPQDTSRLTWARNVVVAGVGHVGILSSQAVFSLVIEELRAAGACPA